MNKTYTGPHTKRILALRAEGKTTRDISEIVGVSKGSVDLVLKADKAARPPVGRPDAKRRGDRVSAWWMHNVDGLPLAEVAIRFKIGLETAQRYIDEGGALLSQRFASTPTTIDSHRYPPDAFPSIQTVLDYKSAAAPHRGVISFMRSGKFVYVWHGPWRADPEEAMSDATLEIKCDGHPATAVA